jgi:hypothetical protein
MKIIITEGQFNDLKNKTKYDFGFNLFKDMVRSKYPFIKNLSFNELKISNDYRDQSKYYIIYINITVNKDEMENFLFVGDGGDEYSRSGEWNKDLLEDLLGKIYDRLPKNVRYNYPDDHPTWPSEAAGINVAELKEI